MKAGRRDAGSRRGFTLVELMVALSGGLFLSMVVFALARDSNRFYQQQTRLANATMSGIVGFDRLRADIGRAGYLSTPNIMADPHVCSRPTGSAPVRLQQLRSLWITQAGSSGSPTLTANGIAPMSLHLAGSFTSTDEYPVRTVVTGEDGTFVYLQVNTGPMARLGYSLSDPDGGEQQATLLASVFRAGRVLRIVDNSGQQHYGIISSVTGGTDPYITLDTSNQPLTFRAGSDGVCGLKGLEVGATANVVNIMRYDVRSLSANTNYAPLFGGDAGALGPDYDADRTELVRVEVDANDQEIADTLELLAEYAVDFQLAFTAWNTDGTMTTIDASNTQGFSTYFANPAMNLPVQRLRAVRARLAVRSREADRASDVDTSLGARRYRVGLGPSGGAPFARVRNFQADIALHNHGRTVW